MGSSVRSNFKEPPWALASYSKERFCLLRTYRTGFKWIVVDLQPSRTREDLKQVQTRHFNEEWAWSTSEVGVARKFCCARYIPKEPPFDKSWTATVGNLPVRRQHSERFKAFASLKSLLPCSFVHLADRQASNSLLRTRIALCLDLVKQFLLSLHKLQVRERPNRCGLTIYTSLRERAMALAIEICIDQTLYHRSRGWTQFLFWRNVFYPLLSHLGFKRILS